MALVNGTNFDHIDLQATAGGDTTRHMLQDTQARNDITDVRSALLEKAQIDGYYEGMTVGNAEQLIATVGVQDKVPYNFRTSGGSIEIGDREVDKIIGGTVAWNQLATYTDEQIPTARDGLTFTADTNRTACIVNGTATGYSGIGGWFGLSSGRAFSDDRMGHVVIIMSQHISGSAEPNAVVWITTSNISLVGGNTSATIGASKFGRINTTPGDNRKVEVYIQAGTTCNNYSLRFQVFDLTAMFGSTIADYLYTLETATPGAAVAWFRPLFPTDYDAYDAGTLRSVQVSAHKMVGFNAYDNETGKALVIGGSEYEITGTYTALSLDGETVTPVDGKFTPAKSA
jgi:hypothetical protein